MAVFPHILPTNRSRQVLGLDIGADGVRMLLLESGRGGLQVAWAEELSLTELQGFADFDSVRPRLAEVLGGRVEGKIDVATVPPWNSARLSIEEMPPLSVERFHKAAAWYFARNQPEDMLEPIHHPIAQPVRESSDGHPVCDALMVSVDRVMMTGLEDLCRQLGLRLHWVVPHPLCFPALQRAQGRPSSHRLVLDIGAGQTRMVLTVGGTVRLVRKLKPCANEIVRGVCEKLDLNWEDSSAALLASSGLGRLAHSDPDGIAARAAATIEKGILRLADSLRGEIERSMAYVHARHGVEIGVIQLCGGLGGSPRLLEALRTGSTLPIESLDPFEHLQTQVDLGDTVRCHFAVAAASAALALERDSDSNILASAGRRTRRRSGGRRLRWHGRRQLGALVASGGLLLGIGGMDLHMSIERRSNLARIESLRSEHRRLATMADRLANQENLFHLEDRIQSLRDIYNSRQLYTPFFSRVVSTLPEELWLTAMSVSRLDDVDTSEPEAPEEAAGKAAQATMPRLAVHLEGRSRLVESVGQLVLSMETQQLLRKIEVLQIREEFLGQEHRQRWFHFEIEGEPIIAVQSEDLVLDGEAR